MTRLFFIIYTLAATTLAGSAVVAVLVAGLFGVRAIVLAAVLGAMAAVPVSWIVTRRIAP